MAADGSSRKAFLLGAGDRFAFAADRSTPLPQKPGGRACMRRDVTLPAAPRYQQGMRHRQQHAGLMTTDSYAAVMERGGSGGLSER